MIGIPEDYDIVNYIEARKLIYFPKYREIALDTRRFTQLKNKLKRGENIQINEVDGPVRGKTYPYNQTENGSLAMSETTLTALINNPHRPFGHGYALAACLLDIDLTKI